LAVGYRKTAAAGLLAAVSLLAPCIVAAQAQPGNGYYFGGSIGQMDVGGDCVPGFACDTHKDTSWKIFAGYTFNRNFALELTYGDWGEISVSTSALGIPFNVTGEIWSFGAAVLGMLPLGGERFALLGKLGVVYTEQKFTSSLPGVPGGAEDGNELHFGFGALFHITPALAVRGEWERLEDSEVDIMSVGIQYRF
jgi:OOP family OmpA-OmpF porin